MCFICPVTLNSLHFSATRCAICKSSSSACSRRGGAALRYSREGNSYSSSALTDSTCARRAAARAEDLSVGTKRSKGMSSSTPSSNSVRTTAAVLNMSDTSGVSRADSLDDADVETSRAGVVATRRDAPAFSTPAASFLFDAPGGVAKEVEVDDGSAIEIEVDDGCAFEVAGCATEAVGFAAIGASSAWAC